MSYIQTIQRDVILPDSSFRTFRVTADSVSITAVPICSESGSELYFGRKYCLILRLFRREGIISTEGHNMAYRLC
jgi:hypothetical protein